MRVLRRDFVLAALMVCVSLVALLSIASANLSDVPFTSVTERNRDAATWSSLALIAAYVGALILYFGYSSAAFFFLAIQSTFYVPVIFLVDYSDRLDLHFLSLHLLFFIILNISMVVFFFSAKASLPEVEDRRGDVQTTNLLNILIAASSLIVTVLYYNANGGLIFQKLGSAALVADARLTYYATGEYTYAGYANQFKNLLLPMSFFLILSSFTKETRRVFLLPVLILIFIATTGTGQRAPLLVAAVSLLMFFSFYYRYEPSFKVLVGVATLIIIFGALSVLQGRVESFSVLGSVLELFQRQFVVNQAANLETYWFVVDRGHRFGMDWVQDVLSIAPSIKPNELPRELFALLWGSNDRGNSPPSLVTSLYFNFWIPGVVILPVMLAFAVKKLDVRLRKASSSKTDVMILCFALMSLAWWTSSTILSPLNGGLLTCMLYFFLSRIRLKSSPHLSDKTSF